MAVRSEERMVDCGCGFPVSIALLCVAFTLLCEGMRVLREEDMKTGCSTRYHHVIGILLTLMGRTEQGHDRTGQERTNAGRKGVGGSRHRNDSAIVKPLPKIETW